MVEDSITCILIFIGWIAFYVFIYKVYYRRRYEEINYAMDQNNPAADITKILAIIISLYSVFIDPFETLPYAYAAFGALNSLCYNIMDCTYYKQGITHWGKIVHHCLFMFILIPMLFINTSFYTAQFLCYLEFGSIFFTQSRSHPYIKDNVILFSLCVAIYAFSRFFGVCLLY